MIRKRLFKLHSYLKAKEYSKAKDALGLFACSIIPGADRFASRFAGDRRTVASVLSRKYGYVQPTQADPAMINVDIIVQDGDSLPKSSAFIRLIGPLTHPSLSSKVSLAIHSGFNPQLRDNTDLCIVQRTAVSDSSTANDLIKHLSSNNVPLILDTDDALFALEKNHPDYKNSLAKYKAYSLLLEHAKQLWVSTDELKKHYQSKTKNTVIVIGNSLDKRLWRKFEPESVQPSMPLQIIYAGTATHNDDFNMLLAWLDEVHAKHPLSFELTVIGVASSLPNKPYIRTIARDRSTVIYPNFARWLQSQGPFDIGVSPLVDSQFNRFKSDIKALDYLALCALPVVSDLPPYATKSLNPYITKLPNTAEAWVGYFSKAVSKVSAFRKDSLPVVQNGQNYLYSERETKATADKLYKLIKDVT